MSSPDTDADRELRGLLAAPSRQSFVMTAGAGSGKTTSLIKALSFVESSYGKELNRNGQRIACVTFTELAAAEVSADVGDTPLVRVSTIHSFLWTVLKPFPLETKSWVKGNIELKVEKASLALQGARTDRTRQKYQRTIDRGLRDLAALPAVRRFSYQTAGRYSKGVLGHSDVIAAGPTLIQEYPLLAKLVARRFPFIFVDESQDTNPEFVRALLLIDEVMDTKVTVGFFGDPMQKIYGSGAGVVQPPDSWKSIPKPENYRCPARVLAVINRIRSQAGDDLQQVGGRKIVDENGSLVDVPGTVDAFVLPANGARSENLAKVRAWLSTNYADEGWEVPRNPYDLRVLVIEHRLAAERLGFPNLFQAFDKAPGGLEQDFREGGSWPLRPFRDFLLPLASAQAHGRGYEVLTLLRRNEPVLLADTLRRSDVPSLQLQVVRSRVAELAELLAPSSTATVGDVLTFATDHNLLSLDERLESALRVPRFETENVSPENTAGERDVDAVLVDYLKCPVAEVWRYREYVEDSSPYATHQGVKGAEFQRVVVILDDDGSKHFQFSYDKLLGIAPLSETDTRNLERGQDDVTARTRRLLYVCCSRAMHGLAVVLYAVDTATALSALRRSGVFPDGHVHSLQDLPG